MIVGGRQRAGNQQVTLAEPIHTGNPTANTRQVLANIWIRRAIPLDGQRQSVQALALLFELRRRQCIGRVGRRIVEHRLDPAEDAQAVRVRNRQQVHQGGRAVEVVSRVGNPDVQMAEVGAHRGVHDRRGAVGIGIIPIAVEDHQPGAFALDAVER